MNKYQTFLVNFIITIMLICFLGCAGVLKNYGRLEPSEVAKNNFEKSIINEDYNYFITGSDAYPLTLFGLNKKYIIADDNDLVKKIEPEKAVIEQLVKNMQTRLMTFCYQRPQGFDILDNPGNKMGEWYSMSGLVIAIKLKDDGTVMIYPASETDTVRLCQGKSKR